MRVAVLGAGYAGLTLARRLEDRLPAGVALCVVDDAGTHTVQHEIHRLLRRPALADDLQVPLDAVLEDAHVVVDRVESVDAAAGTATLADGGELSYDVGALCLGAETDFGGVDGLREHALPLKRVEHARRIREAIEPVIDGEGRIVVGGAGLAGIQVAGELAALADEHDAPSDLALLERESTVAPGFSTDFQNAVADALATRGVDVRTDARVVAASAEDVTVADASDPLAHDVLIWAGGIRGPAALSGDRPRVRSDLQLTERTFALGDAARVVDDDGHRVPASARTAIRQARVAASNVARLVEHGRSRSTDFAPRLDRYTQGQPRWLVTVGDGAVAQVGSTVLTGRPALALKTSVGAGYVGRLGAVRGAVDLVRAELGLDGGDGRP